MADAVNSTELRTFIDRIEVLEGQKRDIGADVSLEYSKAKSRGFNPKAMRRLVAERRRKNDAEVEADLELYRDALAAHGSLRKAAEALGISKSKLQRSVPREKSGTVAKLDVASPPEAAGLPAAPPHDRETGEIIETSEYSEGPEQGAVVSRPPPDDAPQAERPKSPAPSPSAAGAPDDIDLTPPPFLDRRKAVPA